MSFDNLARIRAETDPLRQNGLLFRALCDDDERASLYGALRAEGFPPLRVPSVLRTASRKWPSEDVWLLTARDHIEEALRAGSVAPYAALDSGGRFMLGQDELPPAHACAHARQRAIALDALGFDDTTIGRCVHAALERAMVLPEKNHAFDLVTDVAAQAALRFTALVFGLPATSHVLLERAMQATYTRLTFQIIGRHFVPDDGQPPADSAAAMELKARLQELVLRAVRREDDREWWDVRVIERQHTVAARLGMCSGLTQEEAVVVVLGLIAGTVGNVTSAVANTIDHFFHAKDGCGRLLIDCATRAARRGNDEDVRRMTNAALQCRPPAPFLARTATIGMAPLRDARAHSIAVPAGAHLLLAMGADSPVCPHLLFGTRRHSGLTHACVGPHLALPLIHETVRQVLCLPGLARDIDPATLVPRPLVKRWGAICEHFPLRYQRDRRLNQQPLCVVLPIKEPVAENAQKLELLTRAGAPVVERALMDAQNVHFAWFGLVENRTHLAMYTVYDGDFDAYVEHFALKVPLFDEQFKYLEGAPPSPIRLHPKEFVDMIRHYNRAPLAGYFYSAYPQVGVASILHERLDRP